MKMTENLHVFPVGKKSKTINNYIYIDASHDDMVFNTLLDYAQSKDNYYPFEIYEDNNTEIYLKALLEKLHENKHKTKLLAFSFGDIPFSKILLNKIKEGMLEIEFYYEDIVLNQQSLNFTLARWKFESELQVFPQI